MVKHLDNSLLGHKLDRRISEIVEQYGEGKEITLPDNIDEFRSGAFLAAQQGRYKYIEFQYDQAEKIHMEDCELITGKTKLYDQSIYLESLPINFSDDHRARAKIMVKNPVSMHRFDFIKVDFERNKSNSFYIGISNRYVYDMDLKFTRGELPERAYSSGNAEMLYSTFYGDSLSLYKYQGEARLADAEVHSCCFHDKITCFINISTGYIQINNEDKLGYPHCVLGEDRYLSLGHAPYAGGNAVSKIHEVVFAKEKGYLYLKPLALEKPKTKIIMLYSGNVGIEYFLRKEGVWKKVQPDGEINGMDNVIFRLNMARGERIYKLLLI